MGDKVPQQVAPPKFEPTVQTSLNTNIMPNFKIALNNIEQLNNKQGVTWK